MTAVTVAGAGSCRSSSALPAAGTVDALDPIGLDELVARAALATRTDRKYLIPIGALDGLLTGLEPGTRVLEIDGERRFGYESVYFDTRDLVSYLAAAHRRRRRFKVRTRTYLDAERCFVEVKTRGSRGSTVKTRVPHDPDERGVLTDEGRDFARSVLGRVAAAVDAGALVATLVSRYDRVTLHLPSTDARVTVDSALTWSTPRDDDVGRLTLRGLAVVETKTGSTPSSVDRLLWRAGYRPVRLSKYGTGMAALHPGLPATRWRRTLDRHVLPATA